MEPFKRLEAVAVPLEQPNMDTDQIIPARFLWRARSSGYGEMLFNDLRYTPDGGLNTDFILNQPDYAGARILLADRNFGCGSSREQAVWALYDYGIRVVIAPSFGDIFYNNCCKQGVLPVVLPEPDVTALRHAVAQAPGAVMLVDLEKQQVTGPDGKQIGFEIAAFRRRQLLDGMDDVALTLAFAEAIAAFEAAYDLDMPWTAIGQRALA
jgi:3-isopropylmalate/(R)-2-methylmalate dehydratase small subunit